MSEHKITIGFTIVDQFGNKYHSESTEGLFDEIELDFIGRQLNTFLSQCGYCRPNSTIFMESITEEEYDAIDMFLAQYRNGGGCHSNENSN